MKVIETHILPKESIGYVNMGFRSIERRIVKFVEVVVTQDEKGLKYFEVVHDKGKRRYERITEMDFEYMNKLDKEIE